MLTQSVSSALGRMYSVPVAEDDHLPVRRIEAVNRLQPTAARAPGVDQPSTAGLREERELALQRAALTGGVRAAFLALDGTTRTASATSGAPGPMPPEAPVGTEAQPPEPTSEPDPLLDAAIMRFMHAVFRSLAEVDGDAPAGMRPAVDATAGESTLDRPPLARGIEALAARWAAAGDPGDRLEQAVGIDGAPSRRDLADAFSQTLRSLRSGTDRLGAGAADGPPTRGDLVQLLQRLAQAVGGGAPTLAALPTSGSLLRERA